MVKIKTEQSVQNKKKYFAYIAIFAVVIFLVATLTHRKSASNIEETDKQNQVTHLEDNAKSSAEETIANSCSICGESFDNRGYEEGPDGVWRELDVGYQGQICSPACGERHNQQFNNVAKKYGVDLEDSQTNTTNSNEYKMGNDGRVYEQNRCSLCKGTGIETGRNIATGETEGRVCPMCEGKGVRSY